MRKGYLVWTVVTLAVIAAAVIAARIGWQHWYDYEYPSYTLRYRLTVEAQAGDEVKTGSSVIEAEYGWQPPILAQPGGRGGHRGEAVFVDLGGGRNLIVTLTNRESGRPMVAGETTVTDAESLPLVVFGIRPDKRTMPEQIEKARAMGAVDVPLWRLPTTVTYRDLADPTSIELVLPEAVEKTLPGVSIRRATAQITNDPLVWSIVKHLPWLPEYRNKLLDGRHVITIEAENRLANAFGAGTFSTKRD